MSNEPDFTPEEQAAYEAMQKEATGRDEPPEEPVEQAEAAEQPEPVDEPTEAAEQPEEDGEKETKEKPTPPFDWASLSDEQRDSVQRVLDGKPPQGMVPHQSLRETREELKALKKQIEAAQAPKQEAEQPPEYVDPLEDPAGFKKWAEYNRDTTTKTADEMRKERDAAAEHQRMVQQAAAQEAEFAEAQPDYSEAAKFLHDTRAEQLRNAGYSDQELTQQISQEIRGIYNGANQMGMNWAEAVYTLAKKNGYTPKQESGKKEAEKIEARAKAQKETQGLGSSGGNAKRGKYTAQQLANMSPAELAKVPKEEFRRAMGG